MPGRVTGTGGTNAPSRTPSTPGNTTPSEPSNTADRSGGWQPRTPEHVTVPGASDGFGLTSEPRLGAAVGPGARNNPQDVRLVQSRLRELRYTAGRPGVMDRQTTDALKLFESIIRGYEQRSEATG